MTRELAQVQFIQEKDFDWRAYIKGQMEAGVYIAKFDPALARNIEDNFRQYDFDMREKWSIPTDKTPLYLQSLEHNQIHNEILQESQ